MDAALFTKMLLDKSVLHLKKMQYKYSAETVSEMIMLLKKTMYKPLPLQDFRGENLVYLESVAQVKMSAYRALFSSHHSVGTYGLKAMEHEIQSTLAIENIQSSRDSIRRILGGYAPKDDMEKRIYGIKKGLEFLSDTSNKITEDNIYKLYRMTVGDYLAEGEKLAPGRLYRHDSVFIVGSKVEHQGLDHKKLPAAMGQLVDFINAKTKMNDLLKAATIHFYVAYLHPYFDGNGRVARLIHLWYLIQQGYSSAMFIPFSSYISKTKKEYYDTYTQIEENYKISKIVDVTPFLIYFIDHIYNQMGDTQNHNDTIVRYQAALAESKVTEKERDLFGFVLSVYGNSEFSTKQLERDFGNAAYATIRSFVLKFEKLEIFSSQSYGNRVKYKINP